MKPRGAVSLRGGFLMRGLLGAEEATGALALGDTVRTGQTLRFFARDGFRER